ncbi:endo-1,3-alpha-glucanase family glycosylhydrolase [Jatrophihabitans sp.]|uniref:endo-1,3-alpha-glucanase family glycosylhydrolase n=1 Tax=Jatrophihabitans sp. TaxID=1932789 RepID=UPI002BF7B08B|nr:endo-1,3-alpha-glucanase family glycosylhydrolase [Jatrophihabitans sp.]
MIRAVARTALSAVLVIATSLGTAAGAAPERAVGTVAAGPAATSTAPASPPGPPLFAYYYQWFVPNSWNRAKVDLPELGAYSSDDPWVMRQHIQQAKAAGITGFIVSWKDTPTNTRRLHALATVAAEEKFSLSMIYQGLDFDRKPLPAARVAADFVTFAKQFAGNPVFARMGGKPLTIFSGTWAYSAADVARITSGVRPGLLVLSTEKSVEGYRRLADVTDGDAYYWSSVNPATNANYAAKLDAMSAAVHADAKYWIAPFAPGFDARLVGGTKSVPRNDGRTLRVEYGTALKSSPDALGLISWNEFSENTYVEPSKKFGHRYLDVLAELRHTAAPVPASAEDSSAQPLPTGPGRRWPTVALLLGLPAVLLAGLAVLGHRLRRRARAARARPDRRMAGPTAAEHT